ncbi:MAG: LysM peptidoglycan-binding domain-containing protein [Deltaproteobacteria bacterium]|nr:LysM peptidoglycan-binding domain-containing protein [Deltaproteobacteria bacterium]
MKLVGWMSMVAVLIAGTAIAQVDEAGEDQEAQKAKVEVPADMPQTHTVTEGDTLWDITQAYYGDPYKWPQVWSYNPDITNPHWIYPDAQVQLRPGDDQLVETAPRGFLGVHHRRQRRAHDDGRHRHGVRALQRRRRARDRPRLHDFSQDAEARARGLGKGDPRANHRRSEAPGLRREAPGG